MKERLPVGNLYIYQIQHLKNPNTWLQTSNKHYHIDNLYKLQPLLENSCYKNKELSQNILCEIGDNFRLIGDLVISVNKILSKDNILFDLKDGKIKAILENEEDVQEVYYYSFTSKKWRDSISKPKSKYNSLHILQFKTFLLKKNNEAREFIKGNNAMKYTFDSFDEKIVIPPKKEIILNKIKKEGKIIREKRNGIKRPNPGGLCAAVWDYLDENGNTTPKELKLIAESKSWNPNNAQMELYQWRKFHGLTKNQQKIIEVSPLIRQEEILQNYNVPETLDSENEIFDTLYSFQS
jgi:hypothetical protein